MQKNFYKILILNTCSLNTKFAGLYLKRLKSKVYFYIFCHKNQDYILKKLFLTCSVVFFTQEKILF